MLNCSRSAQPRAFQVNPVDVAERRIEAAVWDRFGSQTSQIGGLKDAACIGAEG